MKRPKGDSGFLTIWLLGLCLLILAIGGISVDLWRVFSQRQTLAGLVDAAALAGASGIDRNSARTGVLRLDPGDATNRAQRSMAAQPDQGSLVSSVIDVAPDGSEITVSATGRIHLTLLGLLAGNTPIDVHVHSTAVAQRSR